MRFCRKLHQQDEHGKTKTIIHTMVAQRTQNCCVAAAPLTNERPTSHDSDRNELAVLIRLNFLTTSVRGRMRERESERNDNPLRIQLKLNKPNGTSTGRIPFHLGIEFNSN